MNFLKSFERPWYQQRSYSQQLGIHLFCQIWLEEMFITTRDYQVANCSFDGCNWIHFYPRCNFRFHHGNTRFLNEIAILWCPNFKDDNNETMTISSKFMKIFEKYVSTIVKQLAQDCTQRGSDPIGQLTWFFPSLNTWF